MVRISFSSRHISIRLGMTICYEVSVVVKLSKKSSLKQIVILFCKGQLGKIANLLGNVKVV